jgi:carbamoyl-phosphate synthase large subunit
LSIGRDRNKDFFVPIAKDLVKLGFDVYCTEGTQEFLSSKGINAKAVPKVHEDPKIIDMMKGKKLDMIIIIPSGSGVGSDGYKIRRGCVEMGIPYVTTKPGTLAYVSAIKSFIKGDISVDNLEDYYKRFN